MGTGIRPIGGNSRNVPRPPESSDGAAASATRGAVARRASPFDALKPDEAKTAITKSIPDYVPVSAKFVEGDHWQDGAGWIGPTLSDEHKLRDRMMDLIRKMFVSKNVIAEIVERHTTGVVGREPSWTLVPRRADLKDKPMTDAEKAAIAEPTAALTEWVDNRRIHSVIIEAVGRLLWATRSPARLYVPPGFMQNRQGGTGEVSARTLKGALSKLHVEALAHDVATVVADPDTKQEIGIFAAGKGADPFGRNADASGQDRIYVSHLEGEDPAADPGAAGYKPPRTVVRQVLARTAGTNTPAPEGVLDLGGRLTMHEMKRNPLITLQVQQANRAINLAATMSPRTIVTAGFLSRIITNAQLRGKMKKNDVTGDEEFIPEPPEFGPATTTFLEGLEVEGNGRQGGASKLTPGVHTIPAQPVTPLIEAKRAHYEDALEEADQVHVLINGDATPSGKSREEARADYVMSLLITSAPVLAFIRWLLETALAYAEAILGKPGQWTNLYRVEVRLRMSTGKPSTAEREANRADVKANLLSRESALEANDISDPDAEIARMDGDPISEYAEAEALGLAVGALVTAGATFEGACRFLELDEDEISMLVGAEDDLTPEPDPVTDPAGGLPDEGGDGAKPASGNAATGGPAGGANAGGNTGAGGGAAAGA